MSCHPIKIRPKQGSNVLMHQLAPVKDASDESGAALRISQISPQGTSRDSKSYSVLLILHDPHSS